MFPLQVTNLLLARFAHLYPHIACPLPVVSMDPLQVTKLHFHAKRTLSAVSGLHTFADSVKGKSSRMATETSRGVQTVETNGLRTRRICWKAVNQILTHATLGHGDTASSTGICRNLPRGLCSAALASSRSASLETAALAGQIVADPYVSEEEEQYQDELEAREAVLKYLKEEEIETYELESVALPPSVAVMKERIAFLKKIGLNTKDINDYPLMVGCSVKKNLVPVLSYLERLNVEARFLPDLIRKYPMVLNSSVTMDLEPIISFLLGIGIERANLGRVLTRFPDILGFKIEGTMSTSVAYLVSLGVNMREIGPMITEYPEILGMRVGNNIKPKVDYLLSLGIPREVLAKVLEVKPFILGFDLERKIKPAIQDLKDLGVREDYVGRVVIQYGDVLGLDIKLRLTSKMGWFSKHAGVKKDDMGRILERLPQILAMNIALAQSRVTFMKEAGFSVEDLGAMVAKCPQILALSVNDVLKPNLDFFLKNMRRPLTELVNYPYYFTYNLEKRIRPRYIQVEQKGINCSLSWFLNCSDSKFSERLQLDFVERPDEEEVEPALIMGGRVRIRQEARNEVVDEVRNEAE